MSATRRAVLGFSVVLMVGSALPFPIRAGDREAARWQGGPIPAEKIYIPGRGRPPGFAPRPENAGVEGDAVPIPGPSPQASWVTRYRGASAHADAAPAVNAVSEGSEGSTGAAAHRETTRKTFGIFQNVLEAVRD